MTILKGTVPSLVTRLRQRLGDAWALNDEAADRIEELEAALHKIADEYLFADELDSAAGLLQRWAQEALEDTGGACMKKRIEQLEKWIRDISEHTPHAWLKKEVKELLDE